MSDLRVLYVEDEENDVLLLRYAFERAGVSTPLDVVSDGREAIEYFSKEGPHHQNGGLPCLVLLDLNLPVLSGFELLAWIRSKPQFEELPVVIFSSSNQPEDRERALKLGANDYIVKPVDMSRMDKTVRNLSERWLKRVCAQSHGKPTHSHPQRHTKKPGHT